MALIDIDELDAETVARKAMKIAGDMCVYTNHNLTVEILDKSIPSTPPITPLTPPPTPLPTLPTSEGVIENK